MSTGSPHNTAAALFVVGLEFVVFTLALISKARELRIKTTDAITHPGPTRSLVV